MHLHLWVARPIPVNVEPALSWVGNATEAAQDVRNLFLSLPLQSCLLKSFIYETFPFISNIYTQIPPRHLFMARFLTHIKHLLGQTCIANGDDCDPCENVPLPWDRSWESSLPDSGPHPDYSFSTDPTLIPQCHAALVKGLTSLYDTLISLRYLQPTDVQKPPHTSPKPAVAASKLRSCGFEPEVIELMSYLPYLTGSAYDRTRHSIHPFELAPSSMPQSYLEDVDDEHLRHARDSFGLYKNDIPPWALRLTVAWRGGTNYIYDTRDGEFNISPILYMRFPFRMSLCSPKPTILSPSDLFFLCSILRFPPANTPLTTPQER